MTYFKKRTNQSGFTLVEVMISMGIFIVLITIGIGAVLDATSEHARAENQRNVMDNLNFVMEDMARNVRLGTEFRCLNSTTDGSPNGYFSDGTETGDITPSDCSQSQAGTKIVFKDQEDQNTMYVISPSSFPNKIIKQTGDLSATATAEDITPEGITIDSTKSGFLVTGSLALDGRQPTVTIRLAGTITFQNSTSSFSIETTVEQRLLDS